MNPRLLALLGSTETEKLFFPAIRFKRNQELTQKKLNWSWKEVNYKIYPSAIRSWTMCPRRYVHEDVHKPPSFPIESYYKMEVGTYLHKMYQDCAEGIEELLWKPPSFTGVPLPAKLTDQMREFGKDDETAFRKWLLYKYNEIRPEVPVFDTFSGVSGRADAVLNMRGEPVVFDIKTTSVEDAKFDPKTGEWELDCWNKYKKKLPSEEHKIQVSIYCYLMNKFNYYDKPVRKAGLGYVNLLMKAGESAAEFETYFDFDEAQEKKIGLLLEHLGRERRAYIENKETVCEYPLCRAHNLARTIEAAKQEAVSE